MTAVESRTLTATDIQQLAQRLYDDERAVRAGAPLSDAHPEMTVADAYAVLGYGGAAEGTRVEALARLPDVVRPGVPVHA